MNSDGTFSVDCLDVCHRGERRTVKVAIGVILLLNMIAFIVAVVAIVDPTLPTTLQDKTVLNVASDEAYRESLVGLLNLEQSKENDEDDPPNLQFLNLLKSVAHFSGLNLNTRQSRLFFEKEALGQEGLLPAVRSWATPKDPDKTLLYNGMSYENGSITVPVAGVYHITSHVKFYIEDNRKDDKLLQTFQHQVVRYSASSQTQVVLFENAVTECKEGINDGAHLKYPSDASGLAQLDAGDNIIVKVSHPHLLKHDMQTLAFS